MPNNQLLIYLDFNPSGNYTKCLAFDEITKVIEKAGHRVVDDSYVCAITWRLVRDPTNHWCYAIISELDPINFIASGEFDIMGRDLLALEIARKGVKSV